MTLADRIVVLRDGRILQTVSPRDLYERPANILVAQFLGSPRMNRLTVPIGGGSGIPALEGPSGRAMIGVWPEDFYLTVPSEGRVAGRVQASEYHGASLHVIVERPPRPGPFLCS